MPRNSTYKDLTGRRFGRLTVMRREGSVPNGSGTAPTWLVRCECGQEKPVRGADLRSGHVTSCGCLSRPHGMFGTPEYSAWVAMIQRCTNPRNSQHRLYGGRGITVCERWAESFPAFLADMGPRPSATHSLDRYPNNSTGNYEPGNCRWATQTEQARNKRTSHVLSVSGVSATIAEWAERTGLGPTTIRNRIYRGWTPERAVSTSAR
jgi:hypothetical protein